MDEYLRRLKAAAWQLVDLLPPGGAEIAVTHDGWCRLLREQGECNCDPIIAGSGFQILKDGKVQLLS
jgi:hypothetical protein